MTHSGIEKISHPATIKHLAEGGGHIPSPQSFYVTDMGYWIHSLYTLAVEVLQPTLQGECNMGCLILQHESILID